MSKYNINDFDRPYRRTVKKISDGQATVRLQLSRMKARKLKMLTHVSVENRTTAFTKCRLGIDNGGTDFFLDELQTIAANELAVSRSDILLGEGDVFFAELTGTTADDIMVMTCVGWEQDL